MKLKWNPQEAFADYFYTDPKEIIKRRTVFRDEFEFFVVYGGRGSGKTFSFVDACVIEASLRPVRILVTRELQNSIDESIKSEIENAIENRNLGHFFDRQANVTKGLNGSKFIYKGLKNNILSLKSIADVDIVLCEESESITKLSWDKLLPSIRPRDQVHRGGTPIVIVIYNPDNELDDTHQRWAVNPPPACLSKLINWQDNKYFPPHLDRQRLHFKKTRPLRDYEHEWEGKPTGAGGDVIIDLQWVMAARFASRNPLWKHEGAKKVAYDPAGQGRDSNAVVFADGNIISEIDEWLKSDDLRIATRRAVSMARGKSAEEFTYDECGGFGDGVSIFVDDNITGKDVDEDGNKIPAMEIEVNPFNAGNDVVEKVNGTDIIPGTEKTWVDEYSNAKAQAHGITAQLFYNTFRFIVLGETDILPSDMISLDIEDDELFKKLARELSSPLWVKSQVNSKKKVESKKDMEKRTGQPSPNVGDCVHMCNAPKEVGLVAMAF